MVEFCLYYIQTYEIFISTIYQWKKKNQTGWLNSNKKIRLYGIGFGIPDYVI